MILIQVFISMNTLMLSLTCTLQKLAQNTTLDRSVNNSVEIAKMVTYVTT